MQDIVYVAVLIAFFVVAALFVMACDHIIGSDEDALAEGARGTSAPTPDERVAA